MDKDTTIWNGYTVTGDAKELDVIVESEGYISLDINDIFNTLSSSGGNYITTATGASIAEAFKKAVINLPSPIDKVERMLIQFHIGTKQPVMSEFSGITAVLGEANPEISVVWGISRDDSLGENIKVVLVFSLRK